MSRGRKKVFYHGGPCGLTEILPPAITGNRLIGPGKDISPKAPNTLEEPLRSTVVYFTTHFTIARIFAEWSNGRVYRVEPVGDYFLDPEGEWEGIKKIYDKNPLFYAAKCKVLNP